MSPPCAHLRTLEQACAHESRRRDCDLAAAGATGPPHWPTVAVIAMTAADIEATMLAALGEAGEIPDSGALANSLGKTHQEVYAVISSLSLADYVSMEVRLDASAVLGPPAWCCIRRRRRLRRRPALRAQVLWAPSAPHAVCFAAHRKLRATPDRSWAELH